MKGMHFRRLLFLFCVLTSIPSFSNEESQASETKVAFEKMAELVKQGNPDAIHGTALLLLSTGQPNDLANAVHFLKMNSKNGYSESQYYLARLYLNGQGVPQDFTKGIELLNLSAKSRNSSAHNALAALYLTGTHFLQDDVLAHVHFNIAASLGDKEAIQFRDKLNAQLSKEQIAEAQKLAREWLDKHQ